MLVAIKPNRRILGLSLARYFIGSAIFAGISAALLLIIAFTSER